MLTADELAGLRTAQAAVLPDTDTIHRRTQTPDDSGGWVTEETTHTLKCRVAASPFAPDREILAGKEIEGPAWRITFAAGADVRNDDRVTVNGRRFEVVAVYGPATYETARVTVCAEVPT